MRPEYRYSCPDRQPDCEYALNRPQEKLFQIGTRGPCGGRCGNERAKQGPLAVCCDRSSDLRWPAPQPIAVRPLPFSLPDLLKKQLRGSVQIEMEKLLQYR